jgi:hypothetical protein
MIFKKLSLGTTSLLLNVQCQVTYEPACTFWFWNDIISGRWGWVVNATPRPLYLRDWTSAHCIGPWAGPSGVIDVLRKISPPPGFNPQTDQPTASRYTDWAIPAYQCSLKVVTPWGRVLPEELTGPQLVKKFPAFYGTRKLITAFTRARLVSLSWTRLI